MEPADPTPQDQTRRERALDLCNRVQIVIGAGHKEVSRDVAHQLTVMVEALLELDGGGIRARNRTRARSLVETTWDYTGCRARRERRPGLGATPAQLGEGAAVSTHQSLRDALEQLVEDVAAFDKCPLCGIRWRVGGHAEHCPLATLPDDWRAALASASDEEREKRLFGEVVLLTSEHHAEWIASGKPKGVIDGNG